MLGDGGHGIGEADRGTTAHLGSLLGTLTQEGEIVAEDMREHMHGGGADVGEGLVGRARHQAKGGQRQQLSGEVFGVVPENGRHGDLRQAGGTLQ
jgi:hypothetical protein